MKKCTQWREPEGTAIKIAIAGDFCPREENVEYVTQHAAEITEAVKPLFDDTDLKILQWEVAITENDTPILKQGPNLRCPSDCLAFSKAIGFDVHLLANNHTGDFGPDAVMETIAHTEKAGIKCVGAGKNKADALKPLFLNCNGLVVAVINVAENEFGIATDETAGAAPLDPLDNIALIREARKQSDLLIMTVHGGHEFNPFPSPRMAKWYRAFAEAGADIVFNCHTHCIGAVEIHNNVPVVYSPGNFFFPGDQCSKNSWYFGYLPKFHCDKNGCFALEIIPYTFNNEKMRLLTVDEEENFFAHHARLGLPLQDRKKLEKLFDAWCVGEAGNGYLSVINRTNDEPFPPDWNASKSIQKWLHVKNNFCCESHNDLLRQYLYLIANGRTDVSNDLIAELREACNPVWMQNILQSEIEMS